MGLRAAARRPIVLTESHSDMEPSEGWLGQMPSRRARRPRAGTAGPSPKIWSISVPAQEDIDSVAGQLAALTRTVEEMAEQLKMLRGRADDQQEQSAIQQERIDLAARELTEVSDRLQAAANALRQSI